MLNFWIEMKIQTQDSRHLLKNMNQLEVRRVVSNYQVAEKQL
jgi:hypothetical protein